MKTDVPKPETANALVVYWAFRAFPAGRVVIGIALFFPGMPGVSWVMTSLLTTFVILTLGLLSAACATRTGDDGQRETHFDPRYLAKTDVDRMIEADRAEVVAGLRRIADKLYRRNPREWRRGGFASADDALRRLFSGGSDFPELGGRREGAAVLYALSPSYPGDRVFGMMAGLVGMVYAAFENKQEFYLLDDLSGQKLYNCARNVEIAVWKLSSSKSVEGEPLLLSNELDAASPNLSFEREFGRVIGLLDLLSKVIADKNGRTVTRLTQSIATAVFLPVGALGVK